MTRRPPLSPPLPRSSKPPLPPSRKRPPLSQARPVYPAPPPRPETPSPPRTTRPPTFAQILDTADSTLLDLVDNLLNRGVVVNADLVLALAGVDLVYLRLSLLLCAADRILTTAGSADSRRSARRRLGRRS